MNLTVEHNLNPEELRKALAGMAAASGIEQEVVETLQKACACDSTPKVPRTRAMKELYRRMQAEFRATNDDIQHYADLIAKRDLQKAVSPAVLTSDQLRQLAQAISDRFGYVAAQIQSVDYIPAPDLLDRWKSLGLVGPDVTPETFLSTIPADMHFIRNAFLMGRLVEAVESGKSYQEVMNLALNTSLLAPDVAAIQIAEQQTAMYITDNAADLATKVGQLAIKQRNDQIRQMAVDFHSRKLPRTIRDREEKEVQGIAAPERPVETWQQFKSELHHTLNEKDRDLDRVAYYELTDAQKQGQAHSLLQDGNVDKLVYKMPLPGACAQCKWAYLLPDGKTPRVFKLSKLINNGTNIGRKPHPVRGGKVAPGGRTDAVETLKAVAGLMHPWCACGGPYPVTGYEPWYKGRKKK